MASFYELKLKNAILYFAKEHYNHTKTYPTCNEIFRYLAFLEFESVKRSGIPAFGLRYRAMESGPVPEELYEKWSSVEEVNDEFYRVVKKTTKF
jgi:hypothetical protein